MSSITLTVGNDEVGQMNSPLSPKSVPCITTKTLEDHDCRVSKGGLKYHAVESQRDTVNKRKDSQFHHPMVSCIYMNEKRRSSNETFHVRFTSPIVTEVRTRPRTKRKNKHKLFYTPQDYFMFRREYRAYVQRERQMKTVSPLSSLFSALSYASNYISGLEIRPKVDTNAQETRVGKIVEDRLSTGISASDLSDVLYLF